MTMHSFKFKYLFIPPPVSLLLMIIAIGTQNGVKLTAVTNVLKLYEQFQTAEIIGVVVSSAVAEQPHGLEETILGARNRAERAYTLTPDSTYSVGIESGIIPLPGNAYYMDVTACIFYDGRRFFHPGFTPGFVHPPQVVARIKDERVDVSEAYRRCGLTSSPKIGTEQGCIGLLTHGKTNRTAYTQQAVLMALVHMLNEEMYK